MRVNVYAEEMPDKPRIAIVEKEGYTGLRIFLELPVTDAEGEHISGPFMHRPGDDDSAAVTFWGKKDLRKMLKRAMDLLDRHYAKQAKQAKR